MTSIKSKFKPLITLIAFSLSGFCLGQNYPTNGLLINDTLLPNGEFPSHVADYGLGGWHTSTNATEIPENLRHGGTAAWDPQTDTLFVFSEKSGLWEEVVSIPSTELWNISAMGDVTHSFVTTEYNISTTNKYSSTNHYTGMLGGRPNYDRNPGFVNGVWVIDELGLVNPSQCYLPPYEGWGRYLQRTNIADGVTNTYSSFTNVVSLYPELSVFFNNGYIEELQAMDAELAARIVQSRIDSDAADAQIVQNTADTINTLSNTLVAADAQIVQNTADTINTLSNTLVAADAQIVQNTADIINTHANATNNPHQVTQIQVGLGNVNNVATENSTYSTNWFNNQNNTTKHTLYTQFERQWAQLMSLSNQVYYASPSVSFTSGSTTREIGSSYGPVNLNFNCNKPMGARTYSLGYIENLGAGQNHTQSITSITSTASYRITVTDERAASAASTRTITFRNRRFAGVSDKEFTELTNADILTFNATWEAKGASGSLTPHNQYIYICYPADFGTCSTFQINGFSFSSWPTETRVVTNTSGYVESYIIYRSINKTTEVSDYAVY